MNVHTIVKREVSYVTMPLIVLLWLMTSDPVVCAAASTTDAITALATEYREQTGAQPRLTFASSATIARQIAAGAPADIFVSADTLEATRLAEAGLLAEQRVLAGNRLVMITGNPELEHFESEDFAGRLVIGDPDSVPAGRYAREALKRSGWWSMLGANAITSHDVRSVLRLVALGEVEVGIVYRTDALASSKVNVIYTFPEDTHSPIRYPIALLRGHQPEGRAFFDYLTSPAARAILSSYGFQSITSAEAQPTSPVTPAPPAAGIGKALLVSAKVAGWCLLLIALPGIAIAWLLARKTFTGKILVEALVHAPLVLPPVITGYLLLVVLGRKGVIGHFLDAVFGISLAFDLTGAVIAAGVMSFPLLVRAARLGFEMVDPNLETAAATLGASPWRSFSRVTLPLALPGILTGLMLAFARGLGEFGATIVFAGNIEGETRSISLAVFTLMQQPGQERSVFMLACLAITLSMVALIASDWGSRRLRTRLRGPE